MIVYVVTVVLGLIIGYLIANTVDNIRGGSSSDDVFFQTKNP